MIHWETLHSCPGYPTHARLLLVLLLVVVVVLLLSLVLLLPMWCTLEAVLARWVRARHAAAAAAVHFQTSQPHHLLLLLLLLLPVLWRLRSFLFTKQ